MTTSEVKRTLGQKLPNVPIRGRSFSPMVPFATHRLPPIGYPVFERYYETTTTATLTPRASVSLARGFSRCFPDFAHRGGGKHRPCARTLVSRCRPNPADKRKGRAALPAFQDTPMCLCLALRSRSGPHARGLRHRVTPYYVHDGVVPPGTSRKTLTMQNFSGFNHTALALAPYASCAPCGNATQCSLPSGCQPFSGGSDLPTGYR